MSEDINYLAEYYADLAELQRLWAMFDRGVDAGASEIALEAVSNACAVMEMRVALLRQLCTVQGTLVTDSAFETALI